MISRIRRLLTVAVRLLRKTSPELKVFVVAVLLAVFGIWNHTQVPHTASTAKTSDAATAVHDQTAAKPQATTTQEATPAVSDTTAPSTSIATGGSTKPKTTAGHTIVFSQSTITLLKYTPVINMGFKAQSGVLFGATVVSTSDGAAISFPFSSESAGIISSNTSDPTPYKKYWPMYINVTYASVGTHDYTLTAKSASGVTYTGTIQVIVKPMPIFTVNATGFVLNVVGADAEVLFSGGSPALDLSQVGAYAPVLTLEVSGQTCAVDFANINGPDDCNIDTSGMPPGNYAATMTFDNQYQHVVLVGLVIVN